MKKKIFAFALIVVMAIAACLITDPDGNLEAGIRYVLRKPKKEQNFTVSSTFMYSEQKICMWYTDDDVIHVDGAKGTVTFTSQNEDVVTVDENTGEVIAIAPGTTWINVHAAATSLYKEKDLGIEVEVIDDFLQEDTNYTFKDNDRSYYTLIPNAQGYYNIRITGNVESMVMISDFVSNKQVYSSIGIAWFGMDDYVWLEEGKAYKIEFGSMEMIDYGNVNKSTFRISCEGPEIVENGLFNSPSHGTWIYMNNGQPDYEFEGLVEKEDGWWYVRNGSIDYTFTGIASKQYGSWYVENGKMSTTYNGCVTYEGKKYQIQNGQVVN